MHTEVLDDRNVPICIGDCINTVVTRGIKYYNVIKDDKNSYKYNRISIENLQGRIGQTLSSDGIRFTVSNFQLFVYND